jgi:hypothetical protein
MGMNNIMSGRSLHAFAAALLLLCFGMRPAHAVPITLGDRIDITANTFVLPIQVVDAVDVSEWFLDLVYDPTDVQINVGCDPFGGDSYCSLLTGPVTEGDFFAAGAPFNLLLPGFIELDPITLAQTGRLFGMYGAFGGLLPPSGSGILAYIQFTVLGTGDSPIDGDGATDGADPVVPVPEPGTLVLFGIGLAWLVGRRFGAARRRAAAFGVLASLAICADAAAQFGPIIDLPPDLPTVMPGPTGGYPPTTAATAAVPYFAPPVWSQTLAANVRFVVLSNYNSDAVLDRETGLVWTRKTVRLSSHTESVCRFLALGNRLGWRLPTTAELQSLVDASLPPSPPAGPRLPVGHPFLLPPGLGSAYVHWAAENHTSYISERYRPVVFLGGGNISFFDDATDMGVLCVRTGVSR